MRAEGMPLKCQAPKINSAQLTDSRQVFCHCPGTDSSAVDSLKKPSGCS